VQITLQEIIALVVVVGSIIGWFVKLEKQMGQKVSREELEHQFDRQFAKLREERDNMHEINVASLSSIEKKLDKADQKRDLYEEADRKTRHDIRDAVHEAKMHIAVLAEKAGVTLPRVTRPS
jgi:hypothetical protein